MDRKYHIITFGCQMNRSDSERVAAIFEHLNCSAVDAVEQADFVVINACSVRQMAIDKIWGLVVKFKKIKKKRPLITILTGCLLFADKKKFQNNFDLMFNIKELSELEKFLHHRQVYTTDNYFNVLPKTTSSYQAYIPIMIGCNNYCSYCAVPYVRGREISRPVKEILLEVKQTVRRGCLAVELLGQNVNSFLPTDKTSFSAKNPYHHQFAKLLWEVNQIKGLKRINFTASHPKDMVDEVIHALTLPKQINYLHLALQSGDNEILKKMNRQYTIADFDNIIKKIRKVKPALALGTDIIVGFPGETKKQFNNTLKFYRKIKFDISFNAMYSMRRGTVAANLDDDVTHKEKKRRWHELQLIMEKITLQKNKKYVGREVSVLIDACHDDFCEGNSLEMKRVWVYDKKAKPGDIIKVKIKSAKEWILVA